MATRKKSATPGEATIIDIKAPSFDTAEFRLVGTAPYVMNKFSGEAIEQMRADMAQGGTAKGKRKANREPKDFDAAFRGSLHVAAEGWFGLPATALKASIVRACSDVGIAMTQAKRCIFVEHDGFCPEGITPLVKLTHGVPEHFESYVRNSNGSADIRARGRVPAGWECVVRVKYDADQFTPRTIAALLVRAGISVGIGAGRPASTMSCGMGWGTWRIESKDDVRKEAAE